MHGNSLFIHAVCSTKRVVTWQHFGCITNSETCRHKRADFGSYARHKHALCPSVVQACTAALTMSLLPTHLEFVCRATVVSCHIYCAVQSGDKVSIQEANVWQQNAAAWAERLLSQFPMYRDILQPVALAVYEVRFGLSMMLSQAQHKAQTDVKLAATLVTDAMAFPSCIQQGMLWYMVLFTRCCHQTAGVRHDGFCICDICQSIYIACYYSSTASIDQPYAQAL